MSTVTYFKGRPLADLSREELIEAVEQLGQQVAAFYTDDAIEVRALGRVEQIRRENKREDAGKRRWWRRGATAAP